MAEKKTSKEQISDISRQISRLESKMHKVILKDIKKDILELLSKEISSILYYQDCQIIDLVNNNMLDENIFSQQKFSDFFLKERITHIPSKKPKKIVAAAIASTAKTNSLKISDFCQLHLHLDLDNNKEKNDIINKFKKKLIDNNVKNTELFFDNVAIKIYLTGDIFPYTKFLNCVIYAYDHKHMTDFIVNNNIKISINSLLQSIEKQETYLRYQKDMVDLIPNIFMNIKEPNA